MTTISDLLMDLVEEIVSKVPLKSMRGVRLACKKWNSLTKSESFTKMYISKEAATTREGESQIIVTMDYNLYVVSVFVDNLSTEIIGKLKLTFLDKQIQISQFFYCEGLLLCILKEDNTKVVVWNPYLGQTRWIECRYSLRQNRDDMISYALGYEDKKSCRSHKLLRFLEKYYLDDALEDQIFLYEIYNFDSGLWRTLDVTPYWCIFSSGFTLKGNSYWFASQRSEFRCHIICFDFTSERFGPLMSLPFYALFDSVSVDLSYVREEKLAVLLQNREGLHFLEVDIWITTKIEARSVVEQVLDIQYGT